MTPPAPHKELVSDALAVFDLLESQTAKAMGPAQRREQLVALVTEACRRYDRSWTAQDILKAVDSHLARLPAPPSKPSVHDFMSVKDSLGNRLKRRMTRGVGSLVYWWHRSDAGKFWLLGSLASLVGALVLVFTPWTSIMRSPFVLAARHGTLYSVVLLTLTGVAGLGCAYGVRERRENVSLFSTLVLAVLIVVGGFGGGLANVNANGIGDLRSFQHGLEVVDASLIRAHNKLKPGATMEEVLTEASSLVHADQSTRFTDVGHFDPKRGVIRRSIDLNPTECEALPHRLPDRFHVVKVNGKPFAGGALSCPFIWENTVTVEGAPGQI